MNRLRYLFSLLLIACSLVIILFSNSRLWAEEDDRLLAEDDTFNAAVQQADQTVRDFEKVLKSGDEAAVRQAALKVQEDPMAVLRANNTGSISLKEGLKKELGTVQNGTTDLVRARIADRYGVKPDEVKFFEATNPSKEVKVPQDWDVTTRVMKDGRLMDVPVEVSKGIVHESFYETATGSKPPSPEDAAKAAEYAEKAAKFAEQHSVTVTDYRHPEAYGGSNSEGQRIIDKANMGQELRDPGQISKAIEYKSNLAREKALKLESEGKYIEAQGEWMEQARQYKKQFADRIKPEAEAHGGKVPDFIEKGSKILIDVGDGKISPAKGRALLKDMGETPESFIHKSAGLVEAAQTLRPPTGKGPAAPDVVTKNA